MKSPFLTVRARPVAFGASMLPDASASEPRVPEPVITAVIDSPETVSAEAFLVVTLIVAAAVCPLVGTV
jgi:hypothetical protein